MSINAMNAENAVRLLRKIKHPTLGRNIEIDSVFAGAIADFIEQQERLAKQGQQMRWVPVSERLPETGQVVDLWLKSGVRIIEMTTYQNSGGIYFAAEYESLIPIADVSHWRATVGDRPERSADDGLKATD